MAIHDNNIVESRSGFAKEIDEAGLSMVLDNLQVNQYQYPQKSTVREIVSNAVDAVREKNIAIEILSGKAKEEDYYLRRQEAIFQSSNFKADYFDLNHLDRTKNTVDIIYEEGDQINTKDQLRVIDYGVGLGGKRLEGYFKLSWSSKRNSKDALGKFGIGAKSPLSTGVESYRMISRYNGMKFTFDVYSHKVDSVTPRFTDGKKNGEYQFENGFVAYWEPTHEKNGTEIIIECKKHHRHTYIDAVKSQLLYFKNVKFTVKRENGYLDNINFLAPIIYEDDHIILSDNNQFSKPHLVIGRHDSKVNYGYIDFLELELENKVGNIGIKVFSEDVAINPSRESVIWNDITRKTVIDKFNTVVDIASNLITKELQETDFLRWLDKCQTVMSNNSHSNTILGRLSRIIDKDAISPSFPGDPKVRYSNINQLFFGFEVRKVYQHSTYDYTKRKNITKIQRTEALTWSDFNAQRVYIIEGSASPVKDAYLCALHSAPFTLIKVKDDEARVNNLDLKLQDKLKLTKPNVQKALLSSLDIKKYEDVVVPEDWEKKYKASEDADGEIEAVKAPVLTPAEKREQEERTVMNQLVFEDYRSDDKLFRRNKYEPKIKEISEWKGKVVYGFGEDEKALHLAAMIVGKLGKTSTFNNEYKLILVNKAIKKHFKQHTHVNEFFYERQGGLITMDATMVKWNTARLVAEKLPTMKFLANYATFNDEMADTFKELQKYVDTNYVDLKDRYTANKFGCDETTYKALTSKLDAVMGMQLFVAKHKDDADATKKISEMAKAIFADDKIEDAQVIDVEVYEKLTTVLEYAEPVKGLLNYIPVLAKNGENIPYELEKEIKEVLTTKGI